MGLIRQSAAEKLHSTSVVCVICCVVLCVLCVPKSFMKTNGLLFLSGTDFFLQAFIFHFVEEIIYIHYRSKVWDHLEMSLFFKEKHCFFQ